MTNTAQMTAAPAPEPRPPGWRRVLFSVVVVLVAVLLSTALVNLLAPWTGVNVDHTTDVAGHRWHHALEGAVDALAVAAVAALLVKPRNRSLLAQYLAGAAVVAGAIIVPFVGPMFLVVVGFLLLVSATYPYRSQLLHYRSHEGLSLPLLAISTAAAAALLPRAAQELTWQITGRLGEHATSTAWATDAEHLVLLALAGLASATRLPGWRVLAIGCAAVYCYLGAVAIMLPDQPGSWGPAGGIAALAASVLFTVSTLMNKPGSRSRDIASAHLKSAAPA